MKLSSFDGGFGAASLIFFLALAAAFADDPKPGGPVSTPREVSCADRVRYLESLVWAMQAQSDLLQQQAGALRKRVESYEAADSVAAFARQVQDKQAETERLAASLLSDEEKKKGCRVNLDGKVNCPEASPESPPPSPASSPPPEALPPAR